MLGEQGVGVLPGPAWFWGVFCSICVASQKGLLKVFFDSLRNCVAAKSQPWKSRFFRSGVWPLAFLLPGKCEHSSHGVVCCLRSSTLRIHCSHWVCVLGSPLSVRTIYAESFSVCLLTQRQSLTQLPINVNGKKKEWKKKDSIRVYHYDWFLCAEGWQSFPKLSWLFFDLLLFCLIALNNLLMHSFDIEFPLFLSIGS